MPLIIFPKVSVKTPNNPQHNGSKIGQASLWLIGIPLPILIFFFVVRGCTEPNLTQAKELAQKRGCAACSTGVCTCATHSGLEILFTPKPLKLDRAWSDGLHAA